MTLMLKSLVIIMLIMMTILYLITSLSKKTIFDMQKSTPFECGFNSMSYNRLPFSVHFFMIAVIFLIFDIEIILVMPMILTMKMVMLKYWMSTSIMFIMILILGLMHEWKNGMLKWTK